MKGRAPTGGAASVRVLLVDDDPLVVQGLRLMLAGAQDVEVVGAADDGDRLVEHVRETAPDVVLLDLRMPRLDGVAALRDLRAATGVQQPQVIVLTTFDTEPVVLDALRAGAQGFLLKHTPPGEIVAALRAAAAGEPTISPTVLRRLIDHVAAGSPVPLPHATTPVAGDFAGNSGEGSDKRSDKRSDDSADELAHDAAIARLTDRERQVAAAVAEGLGNAEIARRMYLSHGSVKAHISSALTKLGLDNRTQLAIAAHTAGLTGRPGRSAPPK